MFNFSKLATLLCTAALVSQSVVGRTVPYRYRRSVPVYKRALQVETLDGSPVDPLIVDFLDQVDYMQNEVDNAEEGTTEYTSLLSQAAAVSSTLSALMEDYATFVTPTATSTTVATPAQTSDVPVEGGEEDGTGSEEDPETEPKPTPAPAPVPTTAPTATSEGPVIVTVIPQPNTSIVVVASDGTTNTITRTQTVQGKAKETVTVTVATGQPSKSASDAALPRSATSSTRPAGAGSTAIAANSEVGKDVKNDAGHISIGHQGLWLISAAVMLMSAL